jgi:hypothetical protein
MSKGKKYVKYLIICLVIVVLVVAYIVSHYLYLKNRYEPFNTAVGDEGVVEYENRFECGVAMPAKITSWRGNLYVTKYRNVNKDGEVTDDKYADLIIYVDFPSGYTVVAQICDKQGELESLTLDENLTLVSGDDESYKENYDSIIEAAQAANSVWGILNIPEKDNE